MWVVAGLGVRSCTELGAGGGRVCRTGATLMLWLAGWVEWNGGHLLPWAEKGDSRNSGPVKLR